MAVSHVLLPDEKILRHTPAERFAELKIAVTPLAWQARAFARRAGWLGRLDSDQSYDLEHSTEQKSFERLSLKLKEQQPEDARMRSRTR
ncbi:hypothetical protein AB4072_12085 [Microvirga sp. 2MCAF38]|uniref:hypothetical protein n=1 Tax=Microvirga sp. 2MCAF38 TaxID=3232989 RepID=UPI003F99C016